MLPQIHQTNLEIVTDNAATGDGGNSWGGHQTRIVHTEDGVFTAYTVEGGGYFAREWRLAWRQNDGTWSVIAQGLAGREPVNLLASPDRTLHIIGWPNGVGTMWSGKPESSTLALDTTVIPNVATGYWPYGSAGIDEAGNLCVLSSTGGEEPGGTFDWACYLPSQTRWITQTSELDYRYCYTYMFPDQTGNFHWSQHEMCDGKHWGMKNRQGSPITCSTLSAIGEQVVLFQKLSKNSLMQRRYPQTNILLHI